MSRIRSRKGRVNMPRTSLLVMASFIAFLALQSTEHLVVSATEVQATNEWTLLGENDTIAAGMHVRIDLEKGERWVKLPDDEAASETTGSHHALTEIAADGTQIMSHNDDPTSSSSSSTTDEQGMDFEMMHRTLSNLPLQEQERMQLPDFVPSSDTIHRPLFEERMEKLWLDRQEELRQLEHIDLPEILKERIQQIQTYLDADASVRLQQIDLDRDHQVGSIDPQDIVSVLYDLEYHLTDIDMTRDYYTLGGWPLLVALLDCKLHLANSTQINADTIERVDKVQLHAAWCVGSAVKNQEEFHGLAILPVATKHTQQHTTALDTVAEQIAFYSNVGYDFSETQKLHKFLYALGAMLRGNRDAQAHFVARRWADPLGELLVRAVDHNSRSSQRIAIRLLTLADDILSDIRLHASSSHQVDDAIATAFSSSEWCHATLQALTNPGTRSETVLQTFHSMAPRCENWRPETVMEVLVSVHTSWVADAANVDDDIQSARIALVKQIMDELRADK